MLLTVTTTHRPATDLGYLLVKNPAHTQSFPLSFGKAHVFYPEATEERCTAALLLDIDPVELVRGRGPGEQGTLEHYVNDRPYVASSFLSVAIAQVLGSAMAGRNKDRPELAGRRSRSWRPSMRCPAAAGKGAPQAVRAAGIHGVDGAHDAR
ncbi:MAG: hypothetical protein R3B70_17810 [Polyangiaceae bacterium]